MARLNELWPVGGVLQFCVKHAHLEAQALGCCHSQVTELFLLLMRQSGGAVRPGLIEIPAAWPQTEEFCHNGCLGRFLRQIFNFSSTSHPRVLHSGTSSSLLDTALTISVMLSGTTNCKIKRSSYRRFLV